jgi:hypothetical protein
MFSDHYSFRNPSEGAWFIQSLCEGLERYSDKKNIQQILTWVTRNVAFGYVSRTSDLTTDNMKQIPSTVSMLTKEYTFFKRPVRKQMTL